MEFHQEKNLIKHCQKGDIEKFAKLYDKYASKIYKFIYYKTSHKETSQDLTSETFIKAMKSINQFDAHKGAFQAWLYRIARNTVIDYYRAKKNLLNIEDVWDIKQEQETMLKIDYEQGIRQVKKYLQKLNPTQREIVMLRVWQNMKWQEIADALGQSQASCKMSFSRTIKKLREDFGPNIILLILIMLMP